MTDIDTIVDNNQAILDTLIAMSIKTLEQVTEDDSVLAKPKTEAAASNYASAISSIITSKLRNKFGM